MCVTLAGQEARKGMVREEKQILGGGKSRELWIHGVYSRRRTNWEKKLNQLEGRRW